MSQIKQIKQDKYGLYVEAGGYISRPFFGTKFKVGDEVKTHHFGGSTLAGVTSPDKSKTHNFRNGGAYETWSTLGIGSVEYKKKVKAPDYDKILSQEEFDEYMAENIDWYKEQYGVMGMIHQMDNENFKK
jgi:hypothetical protein